MTAPGTAGNFIKLPPIGFLPGAHTNFRSKRLRCPFLFRASRSPLYYGWLRRLDAHPYQKVHRCHYQPFRKTRPERPVGRKPAAAQRQDTAKRDQPETFLAQCFKPDTAGKVSRGRGRKDVYHPATLQRQRSEQRRAANRQRGEDSKRSYSVACANELRSDVRDGEPLLAGV